MNRANAQMVTSVPLTVASKPATGAGRPMGVILVEAGRLAEVDVERIVQFQRERGARFGEAGVALGLLIHLY